MVIGGGPGGYVAAVKAAQLGKKTCVIEKNKFGGVCLNVGCIPAKVLLKSVSVLRDAQNASSYGVVGVDPGQVKIDFDLLQNRKSRIVQSLVNGVEGILTKNKVKKYHGEASFVDAHTVRVGAEVITADNIIIATGSKAKMLPLDNAYNLPVYTSADILNMKSYPQTMVVIGGGAIGIEFAYYLAGIGVSIRIVEFLDRILPMVDQDITEKVARRFQQMDVEIYTSARVTGLGRQAVSFEREGSAREIPCDAVLMAIGRSAEYDGLNLEAAGIAARNGAIATDEYLRTNIPHIYAVGDVNGKMMLAHTASMEGVAAVEHICGQSGKIRYASIPSCIYIAPEIASVGLTEEQARARYGEVKVGTFPLLANGKAKIEGEEDGLVKVIAEPRYREIVGVHLYCPHATDMIAELALAMNLECTTDELANTAHPHPTISETVQEACHAAISRAIHW
ncbi:MAG: dihydrolipoyl dehydrogenase [Desulfovibrio sp.]|nr:dihydrolipoyl dehydrogenase [Desulfovibrio sp.]